MKKAIAAILCVCAMLGILCFVGCKPTETDTISCFVPDGAPALSLAKIMDEGKIGNVNAEVTVTTGEETLAKCTSGEADMAVIPTNAAVKICSTRTDYCIFSVNVYGVLYVVGKQQITDLAELKGKLVHSIGLGNTPEYVFKTILDGKNLGYADDLTDAEKVGLKYETDASSIIPLLLGGKADFALIGEPAVSNLIAKASSQNKTVYRLFDLQKLWKDAVQSDVEGYPQASLIVKRSLVENKSFASNLQTVISANSEYLNTHLDSLKSLMQSKGSSLDVNFTADIISRCNLKVVMAQNAKQDIEKYLQKFSEMGNLLPVKSSVYYEQVA